MATPIYPNIKHKTLEKISEKIEKFEPSFKEYLKTYKVIDCDTKIDELKPWDEESFMEITQVSKQTNEVSQKIKQELKLRELEEEWDEA